MSPEQVARLLPAVLQAATEQGSVLDAAVRVMAALHTSVDASRRTFPDALSPWRAPAPFVAMLERWVGLEPAMAVDEAHARALVARAAGLWRMRGTEGGLVLLLELATGLPGYRVRQGPEPFTLVVHAPAGARAQERRIHRAVHAMKPAAVRLAGVVFDDEEGAES
jgi:phage tail-like protein